jgi:hypothetical protein
MKMNFRMIRSLHVCLVMIACSLFSTSVSAQTQRQKIALFAPLYLDSAFDASGKFRFEKTGARFLTPGLDFYYGAQMALDSLSKRGAPLEVFVYDTKGRESISQQISKVEADEVNMIIAHSNSAETKALADAAEKNKVPFISATLPNDAGVHGNPYLVILNSTLQAHVEGIYRYLQKHYSLDRIVIFRKNGVQEDQIKNHFIEFGKSTVSTPLNVKFVDLGNNFTTQAIASQLDSTKKTICIVGSLDESFASRLSQTFTGLNKKYPLMVVGMPTWDNFNLGRPEYTNLEILYTTPFYYQTTAPLANQIGTRFSNEMNVKASDMFYRGYETVLRFGLLLLDAKKDVASNLSRKGNTVLTPFDIQPVFKNRDEMSLDYFENKHLYFIKVIGGVKMVMY